MSARPAARRRAYWLALAATIAASGAGAAGSGCGGGSAQQPAPAPRPARAELLPEDQSFTAPAMPVEGLVFGPEALGLPAMPEAGTGGAGALDRQRKKVARPRPSAQDVHVLVALLWSEAAKVAEADAAKAGALRQEARTALRNLRAQMTDKIDATTLHMLAVAEMWVGDDAAATFAFEELFTRYPQHEGRASLQVWLAYLLLRQQRTADAAALTAAWKPDEESELRAYILAWVAFSAGDAARARPAIAAAAASWKDPISRPAVERDLVLLLARTGTDPVEAARLVGAAAGGDAQRRYVWMFKLSESYRYAGDYGAAARALDILIEQAKGLPPDDLVGFRYRQADYAFRLNQPGEAAARAIEAQKQLAACGAKCPPATAQAVADRILKLAQFSHTVYAKSLDPAHYDAAVALYQHYATIPGRPDTDAARGYLSSLQETKATAVPASGKHDLDVLLNFLRARREALAACYERALIGQPTLDGTLRLTLEIDQTGAVSGAASEPAAGADGMPKVAGCVVDRVRGWTFPSRTVPGKTTVAVPLEFRRQASQTDAPASQ